MKVSYNWLKEYIDLKLNPEDLADRLTMAGIEVKSIDQKGADHIFEAEITSNRPDWLSVYGVAREVHAITGARLKSIKVNLSKESNSLKPSASIDDKKGCLRYTARVIEDVRTGLSPKWLTDKIESAGIRPVNNVVDITNFCLIESGQPLHAFDYDKIVSQLAGSLVSQLNAKPRIVVRRARKDEEITTIDGIRRKLDESILVIAADIAEQTGKPIAIAGIMGGKDTEVTFSTKRVLLESAYFDPPAIRAAAKKLGVSTESSYRFERGVDPSGVLSASNRAAALIRDLAKARAVSKALDAGTGAVKRRKITLRISRANKILGMKVTASKCASILKGLGLKVNKKGKDSLEVLVPSFRADLKEEADLIEEIARIYGYDKVPETLTKISVWGKGSQKSAERITEETIRETLMGMGLNEVISHALISKSNIINKIMNAGDDKLPKVRNPLSSESEALRPSSLCGIMDVLARNINRKTADMRIFELGKAYFCGDDGAASEKSVLAIALCGIKAKDWRNKAMLDIFDLKGIIEALLEKLGISGYGFEAKTSPLLAPSASASIKVDGGDIGILGKLGKPVLDGYDIKIPIFISEMDLGPIYARAKLGRKFAGLPKYPSVARDISLIVDDKVSNSEIAGLIKTACGDLAISVEPFDLYRGEQIPKGSKSILYSVEYRASDRTLTDEEVNSLDKKVRETLAVSFNAKIR